MDVRLYQDSWNNISLAEIAELRGLDVTEPAAEHFYEAFYQKMLSANYSFDPEWLAVKMKTTAWLKELCDRSGVYPGRGKAISLGAGTGIVELPLIEQGYDIELQECQRQSLEYIKRKGATFTEWIISDFDGLPSERYDAIYVGSLSYALDFSHYQRFFYHCFRILKRGGKLLLWDPECVIPPLHWILNVYSALTPGKPKRVFWGWLRSGIVHRSLAANAGLQLVEQAFFNQTCDPVRQPFRLLGYTLPMSTSHLQRFIFVKP